MINNNRKGRRAQGQMEQKAKLDSASEITSSYDAVQFSLKGSCRADGSRRNVCTYIVRTLRIEDDPCRLIDEVDQIRWDVIGLCETCRKGEGL